MSMRKAIDEKCKDCIYDASNGGTWRQQTEWCPCEDSCALWPYRPVTEAYRKQRAIETGSSRSFGGKKGDSQAISDSSCDGAG